MTKLDIYNADSEVCRASADVINRILASEGRNNAIVADDVHSLGCRGTINVARYYASALKRFSISAELIESRKGVVMSLAVIDGRTQHATRETVKL
jgi:hypothetical protein